jgi:hypothetical protein
MLCSAGAVRLQTIDAILSITAKQKPSMEEIFVLEWLDSLVCGDFPRHANCQLYQADNI